MKLLDAIKNEKGNPYYVPDCSRLDLPELCVEMGFRKGAEIGVSWGSYITEFLEKGIEMIGIDPWEDSDNNIYRKIISIDGKYGKSIDGVYKLAKERTASYGKKCKLVKKLSMDAIKDIPDRSLDFVYIDANHNFGYVAMDLASWCHKVKKGGFIAGHDYLSTKGDRAWRFVHYIVNAFAEAYDFKNWYVLGKSTDVIHDRELSYLFKKHW